MKPFRPLILATVLLSATALPAASWNLVWYDNGDGAANTLPDSGKWRFDTGGGGWGNAELETYTNRTQNARYDGAGNLVLEARQENYTGSDGINRNYTSARLQTGATFSQTYGRFEMRAKIPRGQGIWPAFWMLGTNIGGVGWPSCGEIDIMENVGYEPTITHGTIHGPGYSGGAGIGLGYNAGVALADDYHVYAVEWEPNVIRWYYDNVNYETRSPADIPGGTTWVYDHPFFLILNVAVGGNWPGNPNGSTTFPQQMVVDYVRVYTRNTSQDPYSGTPIPIPGTVQCEDFDTGGPTVAYGDADAANQGGAYRPGESPDLEACTDTGGGYDLGWTAAGEWLEYSVNVAAAGQYQFTARVASQGAGGTFHLQVDAADVAGSSMTVPDTGGWQAWTTLGPLTVTLPAGRHVLQIHMDSNGATGGVGNFNWLRFDPVATPTPTKTHTPVPTATFTSTRSSTPTATRTFTRTFTSSDTPSHTPSDTPTSTPTRTATPTDTATRTFTRTSTPTDTLTVVPATSTPTSTATAVPATPTSTRTSTPTSTGTGTVTVVPPTETPTDTLTVVPPTSTPTDTLTVVPHTQTPTDTLTVVPPTSTPTDTLTVVPPTSTPTDTLTVVPPTSTPTDTLTVVPLTQTPTDTLTLPPSSATPTWTATAPLPTPTQTTKVDHGPGDGQGHHHLVPLYNPQRGREVRLRLDSTGLEAAELRAYSVNMVLLAREELGPVAPGWSDVRVDLAMAGPGPVWVRLYCQGKPLGPPARVLRLPL